MDIHTATEEAYKKGYEDGKPVGYNFSDNDFCSHGERRTT